MLVLMVVITHVWMLEHNKPSLGAKTQGESDPSGIRTSQTFVLGSGSALGSFKAPLEDELVLCDLYEPECKDCNAYQKNKGWCGVRSASGGQYFQTELQKKVPVPLKVEFPSTSNHFKRCPADRVKLRISTYIECLSVRSDVHRADCSADTRVYFWRLSQGLRPRTAPFAGFVACTICGLII
jgi:hypothetical protein